MGERRTKPIQVYVEPTINEAVNAASAKAGLSVSEYVRGLIINDLTRCGLMTDGVVIKMLIGG